MFRLTNWKMGFLWFRVLVTCLENAVDLMQLHFSCNPQNIRYITRDDMTPSWQMCHYFWHICFSPSLPTRRPVITYSAARSEKPCWFAHLISILFIFLFFVFASLASFDGQRPSTGFLSQVNSLATSFESAADSDATFLWLLCVYFSLPRTNRQPHNRIIKRKSVFQHGSFEKRTDPCSEWFLVNWCTSGFANVQFYFYQRTETETNKEQMQWCW